MPRDDIDSSRGSLGALVVMVFTSAALVLFMVPNPFLAAPENFSLISELTGISVYMFANIARAVTIMIVGLAAAFSYLKWRGRI